MRLPDFHAWRYVPSRAHEGYFKSPAAGRIGAKDEPEGMYGLQLEEMFSEYGWF